MGTHYALMQIKSDTNKKVAKYMVPRVKSAKSSLMLIKIASSFVTISFSIERKEKLNQLESHLINLLELWENKFTSNISSKFARYEPQPVRSGMVGRPFLNVDIEQVNVSYVNIILTGLI